MSAYLNKLLLIALAYFIAGKLSLLLAIPPGFATPVWPAAGIAFAGVFLWGYRILPAVFVGSFATNLFIASDSGANLFTLPPILIAIGIALGATAQACASVYLVKRFHRNIPSIEDEKDIFFMLIMGGVTGALVNAIIGPTILLTGGIISQSDFTLSWFTWWVGDAIGIILFAPLLLMIYNKDIGFIRKLTVAVPILIIFCLVVTVFSLARTAEKQALSEKFMNVASHEADLIKDRLQVFKETLFSIKRHYMASEKVTREEFSTFVKAAVKKYDGIQAFEWVPRVSFKDKKALEALAHKDGYTGYKIQQFENGKKIPVTVRDEYFPVFYVEPLRSNIRAFGFDLGSEVNRFTALKKARDTGAPFATKGIRLIQEWENQKGFLIFDPVYEHQASLDTIAERRKALKGFTLGVFRIGNLIDSALTSNLKNLSNLYIYDHGYNDKPAHLYGKLNEAAPFSHNVILDVAGRKWVMKFTPTAEFLKKQTSWQAWLVLIGGLLFVSLLQAFLLIISANTEFFRKEADAKNTALISSQEQHQAVFENSVDGLILIDQKGIIQSFNPSAEKIFGYRVDEVLGKNVKMLMPFPYHDEHDTYLSNYMATKEKKVIGIGREVEGKRKNGDIFPVDLSVCEITLNGELYFSGFVRDLSDKKSAEKELFKVSKQLKLILDNAGEGIYGLDTQGNTIFANRAAEKILGYSQNEMLNKNQHSLIHHHYPDGTEYPREACNIYAALKDGRIHNEDKEVFWQKDGTPLSVEYTSTPIRDDNRNITGAVVVFRDISERKKAEEELMRSNIELERFAYVASHDLQEPLRMISSFTDLLQDKYNDTLDDTAKKYMGFISNAANRMRGLVQDLLDYSRADQDAECLKDINCNLLLKDVEESLSESISRSNAIITHDLLPTIYSNEVRVSRLIQNLVGNAIKYQRPNISPLIHISVKNSDMYWVFSVSDNGIGIEEDKLDSVFVLFKRLHQNEYSGTGIGLSICKKVVESLGGKIWVQSTYGEGSTFYFSLPKVVPGKEAA